MLTDKWTGVHAHVCMHAHTEELDLLQWHSTGTSKADIHQIPIIISENNINNDVSCRGH